MINKQAGKGLCLLAIAFFAISAFGQEKERSTSLRNSVAERRYRDEVDWGTKKLSEAGSDLERSWQYIRRGVAYYRLGKLDKAEQDLLRGNQPAMAYLGHISFERGKLDEAMGFYDHAVKAGGSLRAEAYLGYGNVHKQRKEYEKAVEAFNRAIFHSARLSRAHYGLGLTYLEMAKQCDLDKCHKWQTNDFLNNALNAFDIAESIELSETNPQLYLARAKIYIALGKQGKADADLAKFDEMAAAQDPQQP